MKRFFRTASLAVLTFLFGWQQGSAQTPRPEYPRPQFERAEWKNLNGTWTYALDLGRIGDDEYWNESTGFKDKITVPFCPESKLSGVGFTNFINIIWYHRTIEIPSEWAGKNILLHFGAVDYKATVYIDSTRVGIHYGMGSSFELDITKFVKPGKSANLIVRADDDVRSGNQPGGKQCPQFSSYGCFYTRTTGIWQTVWLEPVSPNALKNVIATPDIDQQQLVVTPQFYNENNENVLTVQVLDGKKVVSKASVKATNGSVVVLPIKKPKLWTPETPNLYDVIYTVKDKEGKVVDEVKSYAGMRKVHLANGYFYLNNQPYYQRLVLDQGFYPDGIWTAPSDDALKQDIEMSKAVGFNGARLHQKVFEERYYYWADKLGYITWGEQGSWSLDVNRDDAVRYFIGEWAEIVVRDRNHPSLVMWTPFNEANGANEVYPHLMQDLYTMTKAMDPTRPINDASGGVHIKTDIWSIHDYARDPEDLVKHHTFAADKQVDPGYVGQPYLLDEFGGLGWVPQDQREGAWGYGAQIESEDEFFDILEKEIDAIASCPHIVGFCYTQLTDVEQERNGVYYYDRRPKFDADRWKAIIGKIPSVIQNPRDLMNDWKKN